MLSSDSQTIISIRVSPGAGRSEVTGFAGGVWWVRIAAPPVRGKANRELIAFLSKRLGVSKDRLEIVKGHTSRGKVIAVTGLKPAEILKRLKPGETAI